MFLGLGVYCILFRYHIVVGWFAGAPGWVVWWGCDLSDFFVGYFLTVYV